MSDRTRLAVLLLAAALFLWWYTTPSTAPPPPPPPPVPTPTPSPPSPPSPHRPCPGPGPCPRPADDSAPRGAISIGGPVAPDGTTAVTVDLPVEERIKNVGSHVDGAGMCVMTSVEMASHWANLRALRGLRDWCARQPGGAFPAKVDKQLQEYCAAKGVPVPGYVQYEGPDPGILDLALRTGRLPAVTYSGHDGVRYQGRIAHMVTLAHLDAKWACVLDNNGNSPNGVGEDELLWLSRQEFLDRWRDGGQGWAFTWSAPPPPPPPAHRPGPRVYGQCPGGACPAPPAPGWEWRTRPDDPARRYLFRDGVQVGGYDTEHDYFRRYDAATRTWGPTGPVPAEAPGPVPGREPRRPREENYGVELGRLSREETFVKDGRRVSRQEAVVALEAEVKDDSRLLRVTVIGADGERERVLQDLAASPLLAGFRDHYLLQDYPPEHWAVAGAGFRRDGHPTIYVQAPDGTVLHRQDGYDGPGLLAAALRRADPAYDPSKDPDLRQTPAVPWGAVPGWAWPAVAGAILWLFSRKDKS
jgi:hypothetical protein